MLRRVSERHFLCTACGLCCTGWLPLTLADALAFADLFPLALLGEVTPRASKSFDVARQLGAVLELPKRGKIALSLTPVSYIPPERACPARTEAGLCGVHERKPLRCRAMPFDAARAENAQEPLLVPRQGWLCDISAAAPVVYRDKTITARAEFEAERAALLAQAPVMRQYIQTMMKHSAVFMAQINRALASPAAARFVLNLSPLLRTQRDVDLVSFAKAQHPVLTRFAQETADTPALAAYHTYYEQAAAELAWFLTSN